MSVDAAGPADGTEGSDYTERLLASEKAWWNRYLGAQWPWRWNLRRLRRIHARHRVRNRKKPASPSGGRRRRRPQPALREGRPRSRARRFHAGGVPALGLQRAGAIRLPAALPRRGAHARKELEGILERYLPCLKSGGRVIFITPQEAGFRMDSTHVRFVDFEGLDATALSAGLRAVRRFSFPLPRFAGRFFPYNEFVWVGERVGNSRRY